MRRNAALNTAAVLSIVGAAGVALWGLVVDPSHAFGWLVLAGVLPALWAFVEIAQERSHDEDVGAAIMALHKCLIAWAGLMIMSRVGLGLAVHEELLSPSWLPVGQRLNGLLMGLGLIGFGNHLPTLRSPWPLSTAPFAWQQVHRFAGWTWVLGGLGIVGCMVLLPLDSALESATWITAGTAIVSVGRKFLSFTTRSARRSP